MAISIETRFDIQKVSIISWFYDDYGRLKIVVNAGIVTVENDYIVLLQWRNKVSLTYYPLSRKVTIIIVKKKKFQDIRPANRRLIVLLCSY